MVHYDVQLFGGVVLHKGKIAEMATGEGKTLVATLPVFLNALARKGVHMVTVNNYLAKRDSNGWARCTNSTDCPVACIGLRAGDILLIEMFVDRRRTRQLLRDLGHACLKTTAPKSHGTVPFSKYQNKRPKQCAISLKSDFFNR